MSELQIQRFYLEVSSEGAAIAVSLNDVPLLVDDQGKGLATVMPVNEWILPGANKLQLFVAWPEDRQYEPGLAYVSAMVFIANPRAEFPEPGVLLGKLVWPVPGIPELYPAPLSLPFEIEKAPPSTLWTDAAIIEEIKDQDRQQILDLIEQVRSGLMAGDLGRVFDLMKYRFTDDALINGSTLERLREVSLSQWAAMRQEPNLVSKPLTMNHADFSIVGGKRLVKVTGPNNAEPVRIESDESISSVELYFAKIRDKWAIVRG